MHTLKNTVHNIKNKSGEFYAGERYVTLQLCKSLPRRDYAVASNLLLPNDGLLRTSQIDHLVISVYGIFCIETKSHKGWIFGSKAHRLFRRVWYKSKIQIKPNPVEQNNGHIKTLKALIGKDLRAPIVSIIVFPSAGKFFIDGYENVGSVNDMIDSVSRYNEKIYSYAEAARIIKTVRIYNIKKLIEHVKHIERVRAVHSHM